MRNLLIVPTGTGDHQSAPREADARDARMLISAELVS
jgi:hypothetical protein